MAGGFIGAYLLKLGLGIPLALTAYAALLLLRFGMRFLALEVVRRVRLGNAMKLGAGIASLQFLPLLLAEDARWLAVWILIVSLAEALYWPVYHASTAATVAKGEGIGRQLGERMMVGALVAVVGPLLGGAAAEQLRRGRRLRHRRLYLPAVGLALVAYGTGHGRCGAPGA
ncbi:hypothetical protein MHZ93_02610 [Roseomonas sp. ACRSG]|nr:hypothetical protein [Roseomonas sp. ACRSG]